MKTCLNCGSTFSGNYCTHCGQQDASNPLTVQTILSEIAQTVLFFDVQLYKTLWGLFIHPGKTIRSYLEGKRVSHYSPIQFFIVFMTIYLLILGFFGDDFFAYINKGLLIQNDKINAAELTQTLVRKNLNILYFIMVPIIAFYTQLFFKKSSFTYAQTLVFSFFVMGLFFTLSAVIVSFGLIFPQIYLIKSLIILIYFPFAIVQFTESYSIWGITKALFTVFCSYLTFALIIIVLVSIYVLGFIN